MHITVDDFRRDQRQQITLEKLINKEITSKISVTDQDINAYYTKHRADFNLIEPRYHLAHIVVTTAPNPQVRNLKNDKARNPDEARRKIETIEGRLKAGEDFAMLAQNYSEDPNTAQSGGDLGFIPESGLEKVNVQIRGMISSLKAGQISPILPAPDGYRILKLISKEPSGQRELSDPRVQQTIREILRNRKDQLLKTAYYEMARNDAKVANYLARSIIEGTEKPAK
jgi:peptidyl-prolyl cis-trans isomerase SurA